jgi:hypothetical protein
MLRLRADGESPTLVLTGHRLPSIAWNGILRNRVARNSVDSFDQLLNAAGIP